MLTSNYQNYNTSLNINLNTQSKGLKDSSQSVALNS